MSYRESVKKPVDMEDKEHTKAVQEAERKLVEIRAAIDKQLNKGG